MNNLAHVLVGYVIILANNYMSCTDSSFGKFELFAKYNLISVNNIDLALITWKK